MKDYQKSIGMIMKRDAYLSFFTLLILFMDNFNGQAQYISSVDQYTNNLVTESPSLIGWHGAWEITGSTQRQYVGYEGRPAQTGIASHGYIHELRTAFGISQLYDDFGGHRIARTTLATSPKIRLSNALVLMPAVSVSRHAYEYNGNWEYYKYKPVYFTKVSIGASHKQFFGALDYRTYRNQPQVWSEKSSNPSVAWRGPPTLSSQVDQLSLRIAHLFDLGEVSVLPSIRASVEDLPSIGTAETYFVETSMNLHYKVFTLAALYDYNQRIALSAGYTFKERIRLSYAYTFIHNEEVRRHSLALRTIFFKGQRKDSFIQDIGLL